MGIHFACHHCNHSLHVKDFQAGKRGRCPECKGSFRIPMSDASHSLVIDAESPSESVLLSYVAEGTSQATLSVAQPKPNAKPPSSSPLESSDKNEEKVVAPYQSTSPQPVLKPPPSGYSGMPTALANAMSASWFVRPPSGGQFGPASSQLLMDWIGEKRVTSDALLWREGMAQWQAASELVPEVFGPPKPSELELVNSSLGSHVGSEPSAILATTTSGTAALAPSGLAKKRREQKRRQQIIAIAVLSALSLILLTVLLFVLLFPMGATTAPPPG
jgi:hypothetical protein